MFNIAIFGDIFFVFSLIYNDLYIYYGLIIFLYGIIAHVLDAVSFAYISKGDKALKVLVLLLHVPLLLTWIVMMINFYQKLNT